LTVSESHRDLFSLDSMPAPSSTDVVRTATSQALLQRRGGWFFGLSGDNFARLLFQANAGVSIIVLGLITFTIFRDATGFIPMNRRNLEIYRLAGLEYVDHLRRQVEDFSALNRYLGSIRSTRLEALQKSGLTPAEAVAKLKDFDAYADHLADADSAHETLLSNMTDMATALKERANTDEKINFATEVQPLKQQLPDLIAANQTLDGQLREARDHRPHFDDPALDARMEKFASFLDRYRAELPGAAKAMAAWDQNEPVHWWDSLEAFIFGRNWITASFWQDWYGVIPLLTGSVLISALALLLAIPLGVAAAIYVNQVAKPFEQKFIKPTIEFISAIPSVVLGFFGISVLGESLRRLSQMPSLHWVPGFPMAERLNASTAACLLALMAIPTIFSLAEDSINNVPRSFKEASLAMGATRLQTIIHIIIPAALSGIMAAILLGLGRVIGETMVVLLCAGNRIQIPDFSSGVGAIFQPVHTMTGIIAQEMGEVVRNSLHYRALFMVGVMLFLISLLINWLAQKIVHRYRLPST
jgi:phosphate transport system permease protein